MTIELHLTAQHNTIAEHNSTQGLIESNIKDKQHELKVTELPESQLPSEGRGNEQTNPENVSELVDELNNTVSLMRKGLAFKIDDNSGQSVVSVLDIASGDIIRQIPNEEALELSQKLAEVAGFLLKSEA
ncbi:flagellar protein FlaG [Pseudomonadota bacterium]|uniref:flagellar protein FlaG n=1 Tax=Shewanella sp. 5_MG-2023 TaxID=3062656 RepID=UPI0026E374C2|nr:flagellar protein FlaG [Shewanella sp. 5_MG-2023]MDO6641099.1 flagellar protein FlaG [Shewanella sp. 5_MG-2023]